MAESIRPKKSFGQHFLRDNRYCQKIVAWAGVEQDDTVLEIGSGTGQLTVQLLKTGARVIAIELDRELLAYLRRELLPKFSDRLTIVAQDILSLSLSSLACPRSCKVVGNLPYNIATRIIRKMAEDKDRFHSATFMVQKEVAERILAAPGSKDYGFFTVLMDLHFERIRGFDVPPGAFSPPPKVISHVLKLLPKAPHLAADEAEVLEWLLTTSFRSRRKTLLNNIRPLFPSPGKAEEALRSCGLDPSVRAEQVSLSQFLCLARVL